MGSTDLARLDATAQADLVRRGKVTPVELVEAANRRGRAPRPSTGRRIHPDARARPRPRPHGVEGRTVPGCTDPGQGHRAGAGGLPVRPWWPAPVARPRPRLGPHHLPSRRTAGRRVRVPRPQHIGAAGRGARRPRPGPAHDAPQPMEHQLRHRRVEQRVRRGRRRRSGPVGPRQRRRPAPCGYRPPPAGWSRSSPPADGCPRAR